MVKIIGLILAMLGAIVGLLATFQFHSLAWGVSGWVVCFIGILALV